MTNSSQKPTVSSATFASLDIRVGRVIEVTAFPEARVPSWKLSIDFGAEVGVLPTSAHITNYSREELEGRTVVAAINLGEKQIGKFMSRCLVLGATNADGSVTLLTTDDSVALGTPVS